MDCQSKAAACPIFASHQRRGPWRTLALPPQDQACGPRKWTWGLPMPKPTPRTSATTLASLAASTRSAPCRRAWPCPLVYADLAAYPHACSGTSGWHPKVPPQAHPTERAFILGQSHLSAATGLPFNVRQSTGPSTPGHGGPFQRKWTDRGLASCMVEGRF